MDFEKVSEAIKKSSNQVKNLFFSNNLGEIVQDIAWENKLDEDLALKLGDEVGYVILGLKTRSSFQQSLLEIGIEKNLAKLVENEVNSKIFSELDKINTKNIPNEKTLLKENSKNEKVDSIGQSFEEVMLNQVKAMMPAEEDVEQSGFSEIPENLPTEESLVNNMTTETENITSKNDSVISQNNGIFKQDVTVPDYTKGDPYREPIE